MLSLTSDLRATRNDAAEGYFFVDELRVFAHNMFAPIVKEIREELDNPAFKKYRHGRCATNNRGCSGPLCRWARRVWRDSNAAARAKLAGRTYRPRPSIDKQLIDELCREYDRYLQHEWIGRVVQQEIEQAVDSEPAEPVQPARPAASKPPQPSKDLLLAELV